jgi:hypothetical protein
METKNQFHYFHQHHLTHKVLFGVLIIAVGAILLGFNFGFIPQTMKPVFISWQMLLIVLGVVSLFHLRFFQSAFWLVLGGFFIIEPLQKAFPASFAWAGENFVHTYYPLLIIAAGVLLVLHWLMPRKYKHRHYWHRFHRAGFHQCSCGDNCTCEICGCPEGKCSCGDKTNTQKGKNCGCKLDKSAIFSGSNEIYLDEVFTGGELNAICGGIELDLRRATLPEGKTFLEVNAICGGISIYMPSTWFIEMRTTAILGGFVDSRPLDNENIDKSRKLIITGSVIFGGAEIK